MSDVNFFELKGQIVKEIINLEEDNDEVFIRTNDGTYKLYHQQDCCEHVRVVKEDAGANEPDWYNESFNDSHTWTKYVLKTENASLEFWFLGESNGYYSENISIKKI